MSTTGKLNNYFQRELEQTVKKRKGIKKKFGFKKQQKQQ